MKTVAKISAALACLVLMAVLGYVLSSRMALRGEISMQNANENSQAFKAVKERLAGRDAEGLRLSGKAQEYSFLTLTVELRNYSPFKAEWINLIVESEDGQVFDLASSGQNEGAASLSEGDLLILEKNSWLKELEAFGKLESGSGLSVTLLYRGEQPRIRASVEYYIFGRYHSREVELKP